MINMDNILEVKNLSLSFGNNKVLNNLSFSVKEGDFLTVLGPNGSGKTVLFRVLLGLIPNFQGEVRWKKGIKIGYLPQGLTQLKMVNVPLSVLEFLSLKNNDIKVITEYLELVGINDKEFLNKKIGTLSGGQFQRVLIVWSLLDKPQVLLFDEPITGIDVSGEETIYNLLLRLQKKYNIAIILVTHDINIVYKYSSNVLCISKHDVCHTKLVDELDAKTLEKLYGMPIKFYKHNH